MTLTLSLGDDLEEILGHTYSIRCSRQVTDGLVGTPSPGFIDLIASSVLGTPETHPLLRPGPPATLAYAGTPLGTFRIDQTLMDYQYGDKADTADYRLHLTGTDTTGVLASTPGPRTTITGTLRQRADHILAGTGIAYDIHDDSAPATSEVIATVGETDTPATVLSQLVDAVATTRGWMHLDAAGVLQIYAASTRTRTTGYRPVMTFTDTAYPGRPEDVAYYTALAPSYDTGDIVNVLDITDTTTDVTTSHVDADSVATWGPASDKLDITDGNPEARSRVIFATRATPRTLPKSVSLKVGPGATSPGQIAALELHDIVTVERRGLAPAVMAITGIEHRISATRRAKDRHIKWYVTLNLRPPDLIPLTWDETPETVTWGDAPAPLTWAAAVNWTP